MAHRISSCEENRIIEILYAADVAFDEIIHVLQSLPTTPGFTDGYHLVADFSDARVALNAGEISRIGDIARRLEPLCGRARWALVSSQLVVFGLTRMYAMLADHEFVELRCFMRRADADAWLGAGAPALSRDAVT